MVQDESTQKVSPLRAIVQPFVALSGAPRALWGVNLSYFFDGLVYFGMLSLLGMYFEKYVRLDDIWVSRSVGFLTWGITFSMFFFGGKADKWGPRFALVSSTGSMLLGRFILAAAVTLGIVGAGLWSPLHWVALGGMLFIVLGNGVYQPGAYAAVKQFTSEKTAAMGYAMLYAGSNLGGWLPSFLSPVREAYGIVGVFWLYCAIGLFALLLTAVLLSPDAVRRATVSRASETTTKEQTPKSAGGAIAWLRAHPLADMRFSFFIFCLIPVQTLFAHSWLTLPQYVERAFKGQWIAKHFEAATNLNPLLIFLLVPPITAYTEGADTYKMIVVGTGIMAAPTFLLAMRPQTWALITSLVIKSVGEAIWQPRFLQYAAELAPPGRTGAYMGVAYFPWFLTKMITSLYAGWFLARYCPKSGPVQAETMWLIHGLVACASTILLLVARSWLVAGLRRSKVAA